MSPIVGLKGHTFLTSCGWPFLYSSDGTFLSLAGATSTLSRHAHARAPAKRASSAISPLICRNARPVWLSRRPANSVWRLHVNALTTRRQGANTLEEQWFQQHLQHMISEAIVPYKHLHHVLQPWQPKEVANLAAHFLEHDSHLEGCTHGVRFACSDPRGSKFLYRFWLHAPSAAMLSQVFAMSWSVACTCRTSEALCFI